MSVPTSEVEVKEIIPEVEIKEAIKLLKKYGEQLIRGPSGQDDKQWEKMIFELRDKFPGASERRYEFLKLIDPYLDSGVRFRLLNGLLKNEFENSKATFLRGNNFERAVFKFYDKNQDLLDRIAAFKNYDSTFLNNIMSCVSDSVMQQFAKMGLEHDEELFKYVAFNYIATPFAEVMASAKQPEQGFLKVVIELLKGGNYQKCLTKMEDNLNTQKDKIQKAGLNEEQSTIKLNELEDAYNKSRKLLEGIQKADLRTQFNQTKDRYNQLKSKDIPSLSSNDNRIEKVEQFKSKYKPTLLQRFTESKVGKAINSVWQSITTTIGNKINQYFSAAPKETVNEPTSEIKTSTPSKQKVFEDKENRDLERNIQFWSKRIESSIDIMKQFAVNSRADDSVSLNNEEFPTYLYKVTTSDFFEEMQQIENLKQKYADVKDQRGIAMLQDKIVVDIRAQIKEIDVQLQNPQSDKSKNELLRVKDLLTQISSELSNNLALTRKSNNSSELNQVSNNKIPTSEPVNIKKNIFVGQQYAQFNNQKMSETVFAQVNDQLARDVERITSQLKNNDNKKNNSEAKQQIANVLLNISKLEEQLKKYIPENPDLINAYKGEGGVKDMYLQSLAKLSSQAESCMLQINREEKKGKWQKISDEVKDVKSSVSERLGSISSLVTKNKHNESTQVSQQVSSEVHDSYRIPKRGR